MAGNFIVCQTWFITHGPTIQSMLTEWVKMPATRICCSYSPPGWNTAPVLPPSVDEDESMHIFSRSSQPYVSYMHTHTSGYVYTVFFIERIKTTGTRAIKGVELA